jgi:hypothetical protein
VLVGHWSASVCGRWLLGFASTGVVCFVKMKEQAMAAVVSLKEVAGEVDACPQEAEAYLNIKTGETWISLGDYDDFGDEEEEETQDPKLAEIEGSEDWIALPGKDEWNEYEVMEAFCESLEEGVTQTRLLDAIHGKGAFRRFKDMVHTTRMADQWYAFRDKHLMEFVAEWLAQQGIKYQQ